VNEWAPVDVSAYFQVVSEIGDFSAVLFQVKIHQPQQQCGGGEVSEVHRALIVSQQRKQLLEFASIHR